MALRAQLAELAPAPGASPGLMRRRYSVPETIMRRYSLAQQQTESDEPSTAPCRSPLSTSPSRDSPGEPPHRFARRDRELMRKSALLRRFWGRGGSGASPPCCRCAAALDAGAGCCRETRSLEGSHAELRPLSGWAHPKRQRLEGGTSSCLESTPDPFTDPDNSRLGEHVGFRELRFHPEAPLSSAATVATGPDCADDGCTLFLSSALRPSFTESSYGNLTEPVANCIFTQPRDGGEQWTAPAEGSTKGLITGQIGGDSVRVDDDRRAVAYDTPLSIETSSYEVLEIVVSESLTAAPQPGMARPPRAVPPSAIAAPPLRKHRQTIDIDRYVSDILVESLNSLSDQLESMNASIGSDRRMSIVEKEIKVKLQNTGVNTIVHLSPTSNNQIIFGNEELCDGDERDVCNNPLRTCDALVVREEPHGRESNDNLTSAGSGGAADDDAFTGLVQHESVNKAVLQQIQKLFQDELQNGEHDGGYGGTGASGIAHIEVSNVDVYLDSNARLGLEASDAIRVHTRRDVAVTDAEADAIASVGAGNYFEDVRERALVPRFSAFPHSESMEVNTSSSDDAEVVGSDCTSLVDSLDDPNSPRSVLLRRSVNGRRSELVRSAIDVLDLLPESASLEGNTPTRDKSESFFIRIKDDDCDCEKENINVADHMPEKIKQRLYKRQKKRELRMEYTRRGKVRQSKRDVEKRRSGDGDKSKREIEKECMAIINSLIDDVISKIARDEYTCARIKKRPTRLTVNKLDEGSSKRRQGGAETIKSTPSVETPLRTRPAGAFTANAHDAKKVSHRALRHQIHGRLSLVARPSPPTEEHGRGPKRIYQKSEIHEGNKFIEILEILEYVNGSRSSPDSSPCDENHNYHQRNKKSRIPIPVYDKPNKAVKVEPDNCARSGGPRLASSPARDREAHPTPTTPAAGKRDAAEPRGRRASLGFKRSFDVIPEERTALSVESSDGERDPTRRQSVTCPGVRKAKPHNRPASPGTRRSEEPAGKVCRSVGTSPFSLADEIGATCGSKNRSTMTSPCAKSASTSPLRDSPAARPSEGPEEEGGVEPSEPSDNRARPAARPLGPHARAPGHRKSTRPQRTPPVVDDRRAQDRGDRGRGGRRRASRGGAGGAPDELKLPECKGSSSDSGESTGGLLCSLAPRWLARNARRRRGLDSAPSSPPSPPSAAEAARAGGRRDACGWSVTVAGSCPAALPADVEMRLRFPRRPARHQECSCRACAAYACSAGTERAVAPRRVPPLPPAPRGRPPDGRLTLAMKKEALDSSILAARSTKKSSVPLPDVEKYTTAGGEPRTSVKTPRGCSLRCWPPDADPAPVRPSEGLSVLGCAIVPEPKPRAPTMSERDLTRAYSPRHYLRS